ncbi:hypothetical protein [Psychroserpens sp. SPM9]|uniref:hypothetical protein n=1 Tax=Psychroserpens sp. SPM9 TaxID=2975598 RepID=UPI0021A4A0B3|nr:hypothetical protein [Psychroserpens sp. SPM9]MDG5491387.1 hypothetical protein [Psychroserpens sp. SPM9]
MKSIIYCLLCIVLWNGTADAQNIVMPENLPKITSEAIDTLNFETYTVKQFSQGYDVAIVMINDTLNINNQIKGTNLLAALARELSYKIKNRIINLDDTSVELLVKKFESQDYYINRPVVSQFIKLMNYTCQGDYRHILDRFLSSRLRYPVLVFMGIYILLFVLNSFGKLKWRFKSHFNKCTYVLLITGLLVLMIFKLTCEGQIEDYSFYGFSM